MKRYLLIVLAFMLALSGCYPGVSMSENGTSTIIQIAGENISVILSGILGHHAVWQGPYSLGSSTNTDAQIAAAVAASASAHARQHVITSALDHTSTATPGQILKADANGLPINATNTDAQVSAAVGVTGLAHNQNTDTSLGAQSAALNMNSHQINNVTDPTNAQDAVTVTYYNAHLPAVASGNVTATGMTAGYVQKSTSTTGITNSLMTDNGTIMSIPIITGAELSPNVASANWTAGAGWTIGTGTLTRVAAASTTAYPTSAIVPSIGTDYLVLFTISSWTAGTITMTLGGIESTALQGDQAVYLYVTPYTTGNLIFTPSADFAGVISLVSVKTYTGGQINLGAGVLYYDSRGHPNRLSQVTRHLDEMQMDTLLDKSKSSLSCVGGVLTYTLYAVYGNGTFNFNGIIYPAPVASASITLTGGTDAAPKTNWVYWYLNGNTPTLASSIIEPTVSPQIMVAEFIVGAVSGTNYTIYGYNRARTEVDSFVKRVIGRFENSGSLYVDGAAISCNTTTLSIASGAHWYQGIFEFTAANIVNNTAFTYVYDNGTWVQGTLLSGLNHYSDGTLLGSNERQNIVWGIVPTTTTASGTLPTTVRLVAVLQSKPSAVYVLATTAEQDVYQSTNYYPPNAQFKEVFLPIARTILRPSTPAFEQFGSTLYFTDLRGKANGSGGSSGGGITADNITAAPGTNNALPKWTSVSQLGNSNVSDNGTYMVVAENISTTGNIVLSSAGATVDGVDVSGHASRHQWLGADVLAIKKLVIALPPLEMMDWFSFCTSTITGTGYDWSSNKSVWIATGATNGSTTGRVSNVGSVWYDYTSVLYRWMFGLLLSVRDTTDLTDAWVGLFSDTTTYPTTTSNHYGFRLLSTANGVNADLWATNGDGATETATKIITGVPAWAGYYLVAVYGASDIKYYYSTDSVTWTLGATHTTNRPTSCALYIGQWVKNGEAVDKVIQAAGWKYVNGD